MTIKYPVSSFFESSGNTAATFTESLRDEIATHACNIWGSFPRFVTNNRNPVSSFARGYMNSMCSPLGNPPPPLNPPFEGGQCTVPYNVSVQYEIIPQGATEPVTRTTGVFSNVGGAISVFEVTYPAPFSSIQVRIVFPGSPTGSIAIVNLPSGSTYVEGSGKPVFTRVDGQADNCGNPPLEYPPEVPPTQNDLSTTINITNNDGSSSILELEYNNTNAEYNFPLTFKLQGSNVVIDVEGITIFGDPTITTPNTGSDSLPPGSDGGKDVDGNNYKNEYPDSGFPTLPELTQPILSDSELTSLLCNLGDLEPITQIVKLPPGWNSVFQFIVALISDLIDEVCGLKEKETGLPEIYPALPGAERGIIMYYYKEFIDGKRGKSTYVSTLPTPSAAAIAEIENVAPPPRTLGTYILSLKLNDGSRVVATGESKIAADVQFQFLLSRVESSNVPSNPNGLRVLTHNTRFSVKQVMCTQIEYYPNGKNFGVSPAIVRRIKF